MSQIIQESLKNVSEMPDTLQMGLKEMPVSGKEFMNLFQKIEELLSIMYLRSLPAQPIPFYGCMVAHVTVDIPGAAKPV